jgi:hypothetical protein
MYRFGFPTGMAVIKIKIIKIIKPILKTVKLKAMEQKLKVKRITELNYKNTITTGINCSVNL